MENNVRRIATFVYDGKFVEISPYFSLVLGYSEDEFKQLSFEDIIENYNDLSLKISLENLKNGKGFQFVDEKVTINDATNSKIIGRLSIEPTCDRKKFLGSFTIINKIDESIYDKYFSEISVKSIVSGICEPSSNFVLNLALVQLRKLMQDNSSAIMILDVDNQTIVEANKAQADFFEYGVEELRGMNLSIIETLPQDLLMQELELAKSGKKRFFISRIKTAKNEIKDVYESMTPFTIEGKVYLFVITTDITRRKQLERIIEEKNRVLVEANVSLSKKVQDEIETRKKKEQIFIQQARLIAMGEMVGAVAHHWKEPINLIGLLIQDLEDRALFEELDESYITGIVKKVMDNLQIMSLSIDNFMNFLRPSKTKQAFDVYLAIKNVLDLVRAKFKHHNITITFTCDCKGFPDNNSCGVITSEICSAHRTYISGYVNEFKQIIFNLLINAQEAIDHCRDIHTKSVDDVGLIFIKLNIDKKYIKITVEDNGGGFPKDSINKVFEPYYSTKANGSGIGLYMAKLFIEKNMNGDMKAQNIDDGCSIEILIPTA